MPENTNAVTDGADQVTSTNPPEGEPDGPSRRDFIHQSAQKLAYVAPLVLLLRPNQAAGKSGTGWTHP